jgi:hypothetical protein
VGGEMKVSFRTKYSDIIAFNFHVYFQSPIIYGIIVIILIIGIKPNWQSVIQIASGETQFFQIVMFTFLQLIPVAIMSTIFVLCLLLLNINKKCKTIYTDETITRGNDVTVTLSDDYIISESNYSRSEVQWTDVQFLAQTRSHIYLYGKQRKNLIIPKRAFDSDKACEQFWKDCQAKAKH